MVELAYEQPFRRCYPGYLPTPKLVMLVALAVFGADGVPVYDKYTVKATYRVPWMNNTYVARVAYDRSQGRQRFDFYNSTGDICDSTLLYRGKYDGKDVVLKKYARTEYQDYKCLYSYFRDMESQYVPFIPELDNFTKMDDTVIHGENVSHYRLVRDYVAEGGQEVDFNYTDVRTYQQDFYCRREDDVCVPKQWYMQSKSNFNSHYDIYVIEYGDFATSVGDTDFEYYDFNGTAKCDDEPGDGEAPDGPTRRAFPLPFLRDFARVARGPAGATATAQRNMEKIREWRRNKNFTFKVAPNQFVGKTYEEVLRHRTGRRPAADDDKSFGDPTYLDGPLVEELPQALDWRTRGVLSYVKDQLFCGSCWAFAAVGCVEARVNRLLVEGGAQEPLVRLSEQAVVDCFWRNERVDGFQVSLGCEGGDEDHVLYSWASEGRSSFPLARDYGYLGQNDYCKEGEREALAGYRLAGWHRVPPGNALQMKRALMSGPVSVGVAVPETMLYYAGGVYNDPACGSAYADITHAVLLVGWGRNELGEYWIVRNSWSPLWGMDGYIYISARDNLCGVLTAASYVDVERDPVE